MILEAIFVIGAFTLVLGAVLYIPGRFLAKRALKASPPESIARDRITRAGLSFYGLMVALLLLGFSLAHFAPESLLGHFVQGALGRYAYAVCVVAVFLVVGSALEKHGVKFTSRNSDDIV